MNFLLYIILLCLASHKVLNLKTKNYIFSYKAEDNKYTKFRQNCRTFLKRMMVYIIKAEFFSVWEAKNQLQRRDVRYT